MKFYGFLRIQGLRGCKKLCHLTLVSFPPLFGILTLPAFSKQVYEIEEPRYCRLYRSGNSLLWVFWLQRNAACAIIHCHLCVCLSVISYRPQFFMQTPRFVDLCLCNTSLYINYYKCNTWQSVVFFSADLAMVICKHICCDLYVMFCGLQIFMHICQFCTDMYVYNTDLHKFLSQCYDWGFKVTMVYFCFFGFCHQSIYSHKMTFICVALSVPVLGGHIDKQTSNFTGVC